MAEEKNGLGDTLRRAQLITRLSAAAGLMIGMRNVDSGNAILEAIELLREQPVSLDRDMSKKPFEMKWDKAGGDEYFEMLQTSFGQFDLGSIDGGKTFRCNFHDEHFWDVDDPTFTSADEAKEYMQGTIFDLVKKIEGMGFAVRAERTPTLREIKDNAKAFVRGLPVVKMLNDTFSVGASAAPGVTVVSNMPTDDVRKFPFALTPKEADDTARAHAASKDVYENCDCRGCLAKRVAQDDNDGSTTD